MSEIPGMTDDRLAELRAWYDAHCSVTGLRIGQPHSLACPWLGDDIDDLTEDDCICSCDCGGCR